MTWWEWVLVAGAGAAGAPARYVIDTLVSRGDFPLGTMVVNVSGCFLLGVVHGWSGAPRLVAGTGFIGAYTTFSTFSYETLELFEAGETRAALTNLAASLAFGGLAAAAGLAVSGW